MHLEDHLRADQRLDARRLRRLPEARGAGDAVRVDERDGGEIERRRAIDEIFRQRRPVQERERRGDAQFSVGPRLPGAGGRPRPAGGGGGGGAWPPPPPSPWPAAGLWAGRPPPP